MIKTLKNWLISYLYCAVTPDKVCTINKQSNQVFINGRLLTAQELADLKVEAERMKNSKLWAILTDTLVFQAQQRMFNASKNEIDMIAGKMMLWNLDVQKQIIEKIDIMRVT